MNKGITVLICTFNGSARLPQTLSHLANQATSTDLNWEIIVIDNASTDNTFEVANKEWAKFNLPHINFSVLKESRPGKINALETGTLYSKYEYFIICDDDNWLSPTYIQECYHILSENTDIGAVGGRAIPINDSGVYPEWFDTYKAGYAVGEQGKQKGDVTSRGYLFGAGLATRTDLYKEVYKDFPSFLIGRQGEKLTAGEDSEYCQRLILKGYKLFYDPILSFKHYMPANRLKTTYRDALFAGLAESDEILEKYYFITKLKRKIDKSPINRLRLLIISPFRALFASSQKKYNQQINVIKYLLNVKSKNDPILDAIREFEKPTK